VYNQKIIKNLIFFFSYATTNPLISKGGKNEEQIACISGCVGVCGIAVSLFL
jgi:hypothetical protein